MRHLEKVIFKNGTSTTREIDEQIVLQDKLSRFNETNERAVIELRSWRDNELISSDWMIVKATETGVGISSDWSTYRQSLRDLPSHENAPNKFMISDWPLTPEESEPGESARSFIVEYYDPVGLGTTSWVGVTTTGEYYDQEDYPEPEEEEEEE